MGLIFGGCETSEFDLWIGWASKIGVISVLSESWMGIGVGYVGLVFGIFGVG
ncbi:14963_t:CDS:2, partial [Dentiscutata erythropus]